MAWSRETQAAWLARVQEDTVDPDQRIIDPHHHMWRTSGLPVYLLEDLWDDTQSGHNVVKTVFMECGAEYATTGPDHLKPVGETVFVTQAARASRGQGKAKLPVSLGTPTSRRTPASSTKPSMHTSRRATASSAVSATAAPTIRIRTRDCAGVMPRPIRISTPMTTSAAASVCSVRGHNLRHLALPFSERPYADLVRAVPETTFVLDHFGSPVGVGLWEGRQTEVMETWRRDIEAIAACPNVVAKIGGLAMPVNGFGWHRRDDPATSDELVAAQRDYYLHAIDCFGVDRCMFESNFPVDKMSLSYHTYWNAMKKLVADFSAEDKDALFYGTAARVYRV